MGICDSNSNKVKEKKSIHNSENYSRQQSGLERETMKYFIENNTNKQDTLVLNNDVIVSDLGHNPEQVYQKIKLIGEGAFGEVWQVRHKILGKDFAMKIIEKNPYCKTKEIINEINILKQLDHPIILKILDFHLTDDKFYIVTDFCPEGELKKEINSQKPKLLLLFINF